MRLVRDVTKTTVTPIGSYYNQRPPFFFNLSCQQLRHTVKDLHTLVKRARFILQRRSFGDKV